MKYNKFLILVPNGVSPQGIDVRNHVPLGGISVIAELIKNGYEAYLLDCVGEARKEHLLGLRENYFWDELVDDEYFRKTGLSDNEIILKISEYNPDVIGISCLTIVDRAETKRIAQVIKNCFPNIPIIIGGHEATQSYKEILGETIYQIEIIESIDYVCVGPGQPAIKEFMDYLNNKITIDALKGIAFKNNGGIFYQPSPNDFDPNNFALPDYSTLPKLKSKENGKDIDIYSLVGNTHAGNLKNILRLKTDNSISYLALITSYGCGFHCSFCDTEPRLRRYNADNVLKMINHFEENYGIDYIDFMDNNFAGGNKSSRDTMFDILKRLEGRNYKFGFSNGITFESMLRDNFSFLKALKISGTVKHIAFPCENGNDRVLKMIRKPHTLDMVDKVLTFFRDNFDLSEVNREGFFIGGFPDTRGEKAETPEEVENTYKLIEKCYKENLLDQAIFLTLSPITPIYRKQWRSKYPNGAFEKALFSVGTKIWPYNNDILIEMHKKVKELNVQFGKSKITRVL
jgi:anaerobic magnesium-protoporphyrin IX monomethyl ester cyclase